MKKIFSVICIGVAFFHGIHFDLEIFAQMPPQSVVIGDSGFGAEYLFEAEHENEINELLKSNGFEFYYKNFKGEWVGFYGENVEKSQIPQVTYSRGDGMRILYEGGDGEGREIARIEVVPDIFHENFESHSFSKWDAVESANGQIARISKDPLDPLNKVFEANTWRGHNPYIRPRSEIRVDNYEEVGKDYWYSWDFMIDGTKTHNSASEVIGQWHSKPDFEGGEDWNDWIDGSFSIALVVKPDTNELFFSATQMDVIEFKTGIFVEKDEWNEIVWHIRHSTDNDGYVQAWVNGKSLFEFDGEGTRFYGQTSYNSSGSYFKIGSYRYHYTSWTQPGELASGESRIYYDNIKIGTEAEVLK